MPLQQLRVCAPCGGRIRWAGCSPTCRIGDGLDPESWRENMQDGAGTMEEAL